ncbi:outer membrane lipoprotein chaperone LolA [Reinekea marina]|uniref:Outer-membrane lipoprotein carrier protein n=1 Tax=Reinekea marina TaxID=1310421 RepID=A0ABV7WNS8_9GAMM|nr:outer membrane lipoprotein chaperone LolA [Reinekea marina]MDN3649440.1 outer membrane lipoprotein chaperone LolA [Reinekea marina]
MRLLSVIFTCLITMQYSFADSLAKNNLISRLQQTDTLRANFIQRTLQANKQVIEESTGLLTVSRPMKFFWEVLEPAPQQIISNGETLWVYDPDLEQATYQAVNEQLMQSPAMILAQPNTTLTEQYEVLEAGDDTFTAYKLYPLDESALISELTILYKEGVIAEIRILDELDQQTLIIFSDVDVNVAVSDVFFEFKAPEGTDLFEQM